MADILSRHLGKEIKYEPIEPAGQRSYLSSIEDTGSRYYMQSAAITMELAAEGRLAYQAVVKDDVQKVLGRAGTKMDEWVRQNLG